MLVGVFSVETSGARLLYRLAFRIDGWKLVSGFGDAEIERRRSASNRSTK